MPPPPDQYLTFPFVFGKIRCLVICLGDHPVHLTFSRERHEAAKQWLGPRTIAGVDRHCFADLLVDFFEGRLREFPPPVRSPFVEKATDFQKRVWNRIAEIPYGGTKTYGELAQALGSLGAARAVGQACNANPLPLIVPCHRVVASSGLGGVAGGNALKKILLEMEQPNMMRENKTRR